MLLFKTTQSRKDRCKDSTKLFPYNVWAGVYAAPTFEVKRHADVACGLSAAAI